ncbi:MAG: hypothetical protein UGE37_02940, partial [Dialister hominis]|uniref:hypothetical protein n=1 Tax=Dialister hominis TaxID=2582419 RepID=UPI002E9DB18A|nr:hypothetical protein [Dialister hominis]
MMFSNHPVRSHEKPYNRDKIAQNCTPFCRIRAILPRWGRSKPSCTASSAIIKFFIEKGSRRLPFHFLSPLISSWVSGTFSLLF